MAAEHATPADVVDLAPELCSHAGPQLDIIVAITQELIELSAWGNKAKLAHTTLAAHFACVVFNTPSAVGAVTSRRIDKIQENYASGGSSTDDALKGSKFGPLHKALRDSLSASKSWGEPDRGWALPEGRIL